MMSLRLMVLAFFRFAMGFGVVLSLITDNPAPGILFILGGAIGWTIFAEGWE